MDSLTPDNPLFWKNYMKDCRCCKSVDNSSKSECWNRAAESYDDLDDCDDYCNQVESVYKILKTRGILSPLHTVLDVACGTGTYAVKFAPECKTITCIDIAPAMIEVLNLKIQKNSIDNIKTRCVDWHLFKTEERFDLVFVSMSPIIGSTDSIDRLLDLSSRYLCLITWGGVKENPLLNSLYEEIFGSPPSPRRHSSFHGVFNYLYTSGYAPDLFFYHGYWKRKRSVERQVDSVIWQLERKRSLTSNEKNIVIKRVEDLASDGYVEIGTKVRTATILVDKKAGKT